MTTTEQKIREIFIDYLGVGLEEITNQTTNNDLGMDSLVKVHIIIAIEDRFGIEFSDDEMDECKQFSDYVKLVEGKMKA